jgi:hypothetical protein
MNTLLLKQISLFSALIGLIVGLLSLIPFINGIVFPLYFLVLSAGIIIYLKKNNILGNISIKEGAIIGGVIGVTSFIAFCCVYIPLIIVVHFIQGMMHVQFSNWIGNIIVSCFSSGLAVFTLIFLLVFMAFLCGLMNAFSGAVTAYIYEILGELQKEDNNKFQL